MFNSHSTTCKLHLCEHFLVLQSWDSWMSLSLAASPERLEKCEGISWKAQRLETAKGSALKHPRVLLLERKDNPQSLAGKRFILCSSHGRH